MVLLLLLISSSAIVVVDAASSSSGGGDGGSSSGSVPRPASAGGSGRQQAAPMFTPMAKAAELSAKIDVVNECLGTYFHRIGRQREALLKAAPMFTDFYVAVDHEVGSRCVFFFSLGVRFQ